MFDGFTLDDIDYGDVVLRVRHGGAGRRLLVHGHQRTHTTRHAVTNPSVLHAMCDDYRAGLGPRSGARQKTATLAV